MTEAGWRYDARDLATRPELCVEFEEPPLPVWFEDIELDCE